MCPFDCTVGIGKIKYTKKNVVVTQTDRPKSVRNRLVIEYFGGYFVLLHCFFRWFRGFFCAKAGMAASG